MLGLHSSLAAFARGVFAKLPPFNYKVWILGATWVHCIVRVRLLARQLNHIKGKLPELEASLERPYTRRQAETLKQGSELKIVILNNLFTSGAITAMVQSGMYKRLWDSSVRFLAGSGSRWKGPILQQFVYYASLQAVNYAVALPFDCWSEFTKNNWPARPRLIALFLGAGIALDGIPSIIKESLKVLPILIAGKWIDDDKLLATVAGGFLVFPPMIFIFGSKLLLWVFPEYKTLEDGPIKTKVEDLARKVGFPIDTIFMSEPNLEEPEESRNDVPQCIAFGSKAFVTIPRGLLETCTDEEVLSILAHEFGHWKHKHASISYIFKHARFQILLAVLFFKQDPNFFRSFGFSPDLVHSRRSAMLAWTLFERLGLSLMPLWLMARNKEQHRQEFQADRFATSLGFGSSLISFLERHEPKHLEINLPDRLLELMSSTHPPLAARVKAIEQQMRIQEEKTDI